MKYFSRFILPPAVLQANPDRMPVCQRFFYLSSPVLRSAGSRVCGEERQGMMLGAIALAETASNTCAPLLFNSARAHPCACLGIASKALLLLGSLVSQHLHLASAADWCTSI